MARFIDLDDEQEDASTSAAEHLRRSFQQHHLSTKADDASAPREPEVEPRQRTSNAATHAFQCYP